MGQLLLRLALTNTAMMRPMFPLCALVLLLLHPSSSLPAPGMTTWVCKSCPNPNMLYTAEVEMYSASGAPVGKLELQQSVPRDSQSTQVFPVMVETADNRVSLENLKTSYFQVQVQAGSCDNLGGVLSSQYCRGCTNSLGVALSGNKGEHLLLSDIVGNSLVFFDTKNTNTKMACGAIENGELLENA